MSYKISKVTAISFLTTVGMTGCVDVLKALQGNSVSGNWSMSSLTGQCQEKEDDLFCFNFAEFYFTALEDSGNITITQTTINGDLEMYENGEEMVANFYSYEEALMSIKLEQDDGYFIGGTVEIDMENGIIIDFELDCTLSGDVLSCGLSSVLVDGEEDTEDYISDWVIGFERVE